MDLFLLDMAFQKLPSLVEIRRCAKRIEARDAASQFGVRKMADTMSDMWILGQEF